MPQKIYDIKHYYKNSTLSVAFFLHIFMVHQFSFAQNISSVEFVSKKTEQLKNYINSGKSGDEIKREANKLSRSLLISKQILSWTGEVSGIDEFNVSIDPTTGNAVSMPGKEMDISISIQPQKIVGSKIVQGKNFNCSITIEAYQVTSKQYGYKGIQRSGELYEKVKNLKRGDKIIFNAKIVNVTDNIEKTGLNLSTLLHIQITDISKEITQWGKNQKEKQAAEAQRQVEENYLSFVNGGDERFNAKEYEGAKQYYHQALLIKPSEEYPSKKILEAENLIDLLKKKDEKYNSLINSGDISFKEKKYYTSKKYHEEASLLKPEEIYPKTKISEIENMLSFLEERKVNIFDYALINNKEYENYKSYLLNELKTYLKNENTDATISITIFIETDTSGSVNIKYQNENTSSNNQIENKINNFYAVFKKPQPSSVNDYFVFSKGKIEINLFFDNNEIKAKKYYNEIKIPQESSLYYPTINTILTDKADKPNGFYKIGIHKKEINGSDFSQNTIISYKPFGGPSSGLYSVVIPGLGDYIVTNGKDGFIKDPFLTGLTIFGLVGTSALLKSFSNQEYGRYLTASNQSEIDKLYTNANKLHKSAIIIGSIGTILWVCDIVWVINKGIYNKKTTKDFRKQFQ